MAGMQETDRLTLKNGITYLLQDAKARARLADLLTEVMEKYGADNPPPYPVTSVNGQTGAVELDANDVGALPNTTQIPSKTSDLTNDSGFVNAAGAAAAAPVQSVNGQTGAVTVHGVPAGGTKGQVMKKASNADYDADWENESGGGGSGSGIAIQDDEPTDGELVWIDTDDPGTTHIIPEIDDNNVSPSDTWSSQKIKSVVADLLICESVKSGAKTYAANTYTDVTINVEKTGYTPVCAIPWGTRNQYLLWISCRLDNSTTATATIRSLSSSAVTQDYIEIGVLYVKNI